VRFMESALYVVLAWLIGIAVGRTTKTVKPIEKPGPISQMIAVGEVEELHAQLAEHLSDRFDPDEAVNKATDILAKVYLG